MTGPDTPPPEVLALVARTGHARYLEWWHLGGRWRDGAMRAAGLEPDPSPIRHQSVTNPSPAFDPAPARLVLACARRERMAGGCGCAWRCAAGRGDRPGGGTSWGNCLACVTAPETPAVPG